MSERTPGSPEPTTRKRCSVCGSMFECGASAAQCWCQALPPLTTDALDPGADCRCPRCLADRIGAPPDATRA